MVGGSSTGSLYAPLSEAGSPQMAQIKLNGITNRFAQFGLPQPGPASHFDQSHYGHSQAQAKTTAHQPFLYDSQDYHRAHYYATHEPLKGQHTAPHSTNSPQTSSGDGSMTLAPSGLTGAAADSPGMPFVTLPTMELRGVKQEGYGARPRGVSCGEGGLRIYGMHEVEQEQEQDRFRGEGGGGGGGAGGSGRGYGGAMEAY